MKNIKIKDIVVLQIVVMIYTFSGIVAKYASMEKGINYKFILLYGLEILILGVYAIFWQQIIKKFDLSVAYTNRALDILWAMLWARLFFSEHISIQNIIGVVVIIAGTLLVNMEEVKKSKKELDKEVRHE